MTPQDAIQKQFGGKVTDDMPFLVDRRNQMHFATNALIYEKAKEDAQVFFNSLKFDASKNDHARTLFGKDGTMRKRTDPEANAWRSVSRQFLTVGEK